jgi:ABC-type antimicrobial peptide transport system permease subunit
MNTGLQRGLKTIRWPFLLGFLVLFSLLGVLYALAKSSVWFQPAGIQPKAATFSILKTDDHGQPSKMLWREAEGLRDLPGVSGLWPYGEFSRRVVLANGSQHKEPVAVVDWPLLQQLHVGLSAGQWPVASEANAVVISEDFKNRYFGGQKRAIGQMVKFSGGAELPVAAVLRKDFKGLAHDRPAVLMNRAADMQLEMAKYENDPDSMNALLVRTIRENTPGYYAFGTLRDAAALAAVQKKLKDGYQPQAVVSQKTDKFSAVFDLGQAGSRYQAIAGLESSPALRQHISRLLGLLMLTAVLLAVIVLGNYALQMLAELETGRKELGIHVLTGATRKHLYGLQWRRTAPTIVLAVLLAIPVAYWLARKAAFIPLFEDYFAGLFTPDITPLIGLFLLAVLLAGLASLWLTRLAIKKADGRQNLQLDSAGSQRLNVLLATVQLALAALMLGLALNAAWAFFQAQRQSPPLDVANLHYLDMNKIDDQWVPARELSGWLDALEELPGVQQALARVGPYTAHRAVQAIHTHSAKTLGQTNPVDAEFFSLVGLPPLAGTVPKTVAEGDAVINQAMAKALFGAAAKAIGQTLTVEGAETKEYRVNAVVPDIPYGDALETIRPIVYPLNREPGGWPSSVLIRSSAMAPAVLQKRVQALAEKFNLKVAKWQPAREVKQKSLRASRAGLMASAGLSALLIGLVLVGIWAFTRALMQQWRKKLAVRIAMGASRRDLARFALRSGLQVVAAATALALLLMLLIRPVLPQLLRNAGSPLAFLAVGIAVVSAVFLAIMLWQVYRQTRRSAWAELRRD